MENGKQINLPIITKIAAWWIIITGGYFLLLFAKESISYFSLEGFLVFRGTIVAIPGILLIILGIFLLRRKKWAWWFTMIGLPIYLLTRILLVAILVKDFEGISPHLELRHFVTAGSQAITLIGIILLPLIVLYFGRKKFFEITS